MSGFILASRPIEFTLRVKIGKSERTRGIISLGEKVLITQWEVTQYQFAYLRNHGDIQVLYKRPEQTVSVLYIFVSGLLQ
jgi:hypothetical protein